MKEFIRKYIIAFFEWIEIPLFEEIEIEEEEIEEDFEPSPERGTPERFNDLPFDFEPSTPEEILGEEPLFFRGEKENFRFYMDIES